MNDARPVADDDLHAYVDNQLDPARRVEVERYLEQHPEAAATVNDLRRLGQSLHSLFDPVLMEPIPAAIQFPPVKQRRALRAAAVVAWMALGGVLQHIEQVLEVGRATLEPPLPQV